MAVGDALAQAAGELNSDAPLKTGAYRWASLDDINGSTSVVDRHQHPAGNELYVYQGQSLIGQSTISTGAKGHATPLGDFKILQKNRWHRSNIYSNAPMPFMQRLTWDGIAIHAGHLPGYPASHGCIRLPRGLCGKII